MGCLLAMKKSQAAADEEGAMMFVVTREIPSARDSNAIAQFIALASELTVSPPTAISASSTRLRALCTS